MKKIFEEYGGVITVAVAIVALIGIVAMLIGGPNGGIIGGAFEQVVTGFEDKASEKINGLGGSGGGDEPDSMAPTLTVEPDLSRDVNLPTFATSNSITISGTVYDADGVAVLTVNGNSVAFDGAGVWSTTLELTRNDVLEVVVTAKDSAGNTATVSGYVGYISFTQTWVGKDTFASEIGYDDATSVLEIPSTFKSGSKWYRVTGVNMYGFEECANLTSVSIPDSVTKIGYAAFQNCTGLTSVSISNGATEIQGSAFEGCTGLTNVSLPDSLSILGSSAFYECASLSQITIPANVTSIEYGAFMYCENLTSITFKGTTEQWNAITKGEWWNKYVPATVVVCSDGNVAL